MSAVLIVGGTRGLGNALVDHYANQDSTNVYATSRSSEPPLKHTGSRVKWLTGVDLMKPTCGKDLASQISGAAIDTVIITAGVFHLESFDDPGPDWEKEVQTYTTSAIAPPFLVSELVKAKCLSRGSKVILISSEAGSLKLRNDGGGDYAHHASKAALNMVGKQLSYDLQPLSIAVALVHPSFMRTEMTKNVGFDSAWEKGGALHPKDAATLLGDWVEKEFDIKKTGQFWAPRGTRDIGSWNDVFGEDTQKEGPVELPW